MGLFNKSAKKKKRGKVVIWVIVIAVIAFLFWPIDEEDGYYGRDDWAYDDDSNYREDDEWVSQNEGYIDTAEIGDAAGAFGANNREELVAYYGKDVIRDRVVQLKGNGEDTVTILMYMNGSNLESEDQEATTDLSEMIQAAGVSDKVNILVQTMGTKTWDKKLGISSKRTERYKLDGNGLTLLDGSLPQLDCTKTSTLSDFIKWGTRAYPADRYILLFWDHGGGAIYGFGYDEWNSDESAALTIDEMQQAFKEAGVFFDFIGMDCCIMSSLEVGCAFYDYCDYAILSEDFESGLGWDYTKWITTLYNNTSVDTVTLGKQICDDMVQANVDNTSWGDNSIMAVIDESMIKLLYSSWKAFAYDTEDTLKSQNYGRKVLPKHGGRTMPIFAGVDGKKPGSRAGYFYNLFFGDDYDDEEYSLADYSEVDIMAAASSIKSDVSDLLKTAISNTIVYVSYTSGDANLTGLAVTLPYGDSQGYQSMRVIFKNIGMDQEYIDWLEQFVGLSNSDDYYDYDSFDDDWNGWDDYDYDYWDDYDYYDDYDDCFSLWDVFFDDDEFDDYGFDDMDYDDYWWCW